MPWIAASLVSALFLGLYDLSKKHAIRENAVLPILFWSTALAALWWGGLLLAENRIPGLLPDIWVTEPVSPRGHFLLFLKSLLVAASWLFSYFALKHLPLSLAAPVRATGPLWTILGAVLLLGERPSFLQSLGIATTLVAFLGLSRAGRKEGIHFHRNGWIFCLIGGTLLGSISGLYDKYLLGTVGFRASTVQAWFSVYLALIFFLPVIGWQRRWWKRGPFHWRWTIPLIAVCLLVADYVYFDALRDPDALVSVVSSLRRGSTLIAFAGGIFLFREPHGRRKLPAVLGIVIGIVLTVAG